ncbi:MAG TPA: peptide-methionine (S)-S-oxide reductase MsrA [Pirellulales bacterium]|nr:peptide-methionine (S)-S-oxide reductase MsrA [Pirellulales bacterium]
MFAIFSKPIGFMVFVLPILALAIGEHSLAAPPRDKAKHSSESEATPSDPADYQTATFGAGCFWCSEAVFQQLKGVKSVISGYSGGLTKNPNYDFVSTGLTGHAEVVQITFDPDAISYDELLEVFWQTHDPTTLNQQGADIGTQYRSVIFYHDDEQKKLTEHYKQQLDKEHAFRKPIVTQIAKFEEFYPAEDYHQNYYNTHRRDAYCSAVIRPKLAKVKKVFKGKLNAQATRPHSR